MTRTPDKWFAMRTDFFGQDAYTLGFYTLSPTAMALYVASVAYVSRHGIDTTFRNIGRLMPTNAASSLVGHEVVDCSDPRAGRAFVMQRDGYACVLCGSDLRLSLDHIHPYSKGGTDEPENLRVLCRSCNSRKGNRV